MSGRLYVAEARIDEGPYLRRWRPKDRGRAHADPEADESHYRGGRGAVSGSLGRPGRRQARSES